MPPSSPDRGHRRSPPRHPPDPLVARRMTILLSGWEEPPRTTTPAAPAPSPWVGLPALVLGMCLSAGALLGLARPELADLDRRARTAVRAFLRPTPTTTDAASAVSPRGPVRETVSPPPRPTPSPAASTASPVPWEDPALPSPEAARRVVEAFLQALGGDGPAETALAAWAPEAQETGRTLLAVQDTTHVVRVRATRVEPVPGARTLARVGAILDLVRGDRLLSAVVQVYLVRIDDGRWVMTARLQ